MIQEIKSIEFPMRIVGLNMGTVNCFLIKTSAGYILIDTAFPNKCTDLDRELENAGCRPGNLKLIVITHADLDHVGNGAYLRKKYGAKIVAHPCEAATIESGDTSLNRNPQTFFERIISGIILRVLSSLTRFGTLERFRSDFTIDEGYDLSAYECDAKVLHLPGHSKGSIGILTGDGNLFCGDLLWNMKKPGAHSIVDDPVAFKASIDKLKSLPIKMVYPGHGKPFSMEQLA